MLGEKNVRNSLFANNSRIEKKKKINNGTLVEIRKMGKEKE